MASARIMRVVLWLAFAGLLGLYAPAAGAQQAGDEPGLREAFVGDVLMTADELVYEDDADTVIASGNVEVAQGGRVLRAAHIRYRRGDGVVTASGDVALLEPGGEVMFADSVELTGNLRNGVIRRLSALLTDDSRLTASSARRTDGNRTAMRKAVFSPCELCPDNPERAPLWQIKADAVIHDQEARSLTYNDAWLEFFGTPVLYTPYFRHPDPTVDRQTGFLVPRYRSSTALGVDVTVPYYWALAPNRDLTFSPRFTSEEGVVLASEYRERTRDGRFSIDASLTRANTPSEDNRRMRGHLFGEGAFDIDRESRWGFTLERALDDTYLNRYDISSKDDLITNLFAELYRQRSYVAGNGYAFQSLRAGYQGDRTPIVLPLLEASVVSAPRYAGGYTTLDANLMVLERLEGNDSRRFSITGGWHRPAILAGGHVVRLDASVRGDIYHAYLSDAVSRLLDRPQSETAWRLVPEFATEWRFPLVARIGTIRQLVEPIVQGVFSPYGVNPGEIPNEDSRDLEFDHTNLFSTNRFPGFDRIETGLRVNYGVRLGFFGQNGGRVSAIVGQSARAKDDRQFSDGSGLERELSDVIGRIFVQPSPLLDLSLRFRLDHRNFATRRNEIDLDAGPEWLRARIGFADLERQPESIIGESVGGREGVLGVTSGLAGGWTLSAETRRDLKDDASIDWRAALAYEDECIRISTGISRSFTRDRDIQPDTVFHLAVKLRPAG